MIFSIEELLAKASQSIQFGDLLILKLIIDYNETFGKPPSGSYIKEHFNQFLLTHQVTEARAVPMTTNWVLENRVKKLRGFGFLTATNDSRTPYTTTEKGESLLRNVPVNWETWPVVIPVDDQNVVQYSEAQYLD